MKLGDVHSGWIYGFDRGTLTVVNQGGAEQRGTLPATGKSRLLETRVARTLLRPVVGDYTARHVWPLDHRVLLATTSRRVFRSVDRGYSWRPVHELPPSSGPMGVLPTSLANHRGRTFLAEYPLGPEDARVMVSNDRGATWSPYVTTGDVRHFHGLFTDPYGEALWGTTGDADEECAIGRFEGGNFVPTGGGDQRWRAVALSFTPEYLVWGMDCSFADSVHIFRLARDRLHTDSSGSRFDPEPVATVDASVFYCETVSTDDETWVVVSTAAETGVDSTAPDDRRRNTGSRVVRVLAASSASGFTDWVELGAFERRQVLGDCSNRLPSAGAYAFLASDPEIGLVVNPFNTRGRHGEILIVPPSDFGTSRMYL